MERFYKIVLRAFKIFGWNVVGKPDSIFRKIKLQSRFVHFAGLDDEDGEFAMSLTDFGGGFDVRGKVNVLAFAFD